MACGRISNSVCKRKTKMDNSEKITLFCCDKWKSNRYFLQNWVSRTVVFVTKTRGIGITLPEEYLQGTIIHVNILLIDKYYRERGGALLFCPKLL